MWADKTINILAEIEVVIGAMRQHLEHAGMQEQGCWVLRNLAHNDDDKVGRNEEGRRD